MKVIVVGSGPGGYAAAIRCAQLGAAVTLVEGAEVGGTCLNRGCIPTKSLVESARMYREAQRMHEWGVRIEGVTLDFPTVAMRQRSAVQALTTGLGHLLRSHGVTVVHGWGRLLPQLPAAPGMHRVAVEGAEPAIHTADAVVLAPGSVPAQPPIPGAGVTGVVTNDELLAMTHRPSSLCIIGGGVIGCEFASIYAAFGTKVTMLEMLPQLLPAADGEVARRMAAAYRRLGIALHTGVRVQAIEPGPRVVWDGGVVEAEVVLMAVGRRPRTESLGLDEAGVRLERGAIAVNARMETSLPGVYAVGDATGGTMLAHAAFAQANVAAQAIAGHPAEWDGRLIPSPVFSHPEVAWIGLTEEAAASRGISVRVGRFPFAASGRALVAGETEGFVKVVAEATGDRILGVHIIGPSATELINEGALAVQSGLGLVDLEEAIHGHPTLSEALAEAAGSALGTSLHTARR